MDIHIMLDFTSVNTKALLLLSLCLAPISNAAQLFQDGLESGDLSSNQNGVSYGRSTDTNVTNSTSNEGQYSLEFVYRGVSSGADSFSEQRMDFPQTNELWIRFELFIPNNYFHRSDTGPNNNKFLAVYRDDYTAPGFQVNWSLNPNGNGGSNLRLYRYRNGSEQPNLTPSGGLGNNFITSSDRNTWITVIARVKAPSSSSSSDGIMQMWKNGVLVTDETNLNMYGGNGQNYMDELYLLGWANSGYNENTTFYMDNIFINNEAFSIPKPPPGSVVE